MRRLSQGTAFVAALSALACGSSGVAQVQPKMSDKQVTGIAADDASRCDYKGRADREVQEVRGPNAQNPNIRRVFSIVGEGEERKKLLLCREATRTSTAPKTSCGPIPTRAIR
jgi:hypothetical protein